MRIRFGLESFNLSVLVSNADTVRLRVSVRVADRQFLMVVLRF